MQRTIRLRPYAIAIILMGLVFAALNYFLVYFVRGIFLRRLEEESLNYASIYPTPGEKQGSLSCH